MPSVFWLIDPMNVNLLLLSFFVCQRSAVKAEHLTEVRVKSAAMLRYFLHSMNHLYQDVWLPTVFSISLLM